MAFRFRNTIRLAPGIRLNLGKRGISLSAGVRGASVTLGKNGLWGNVGAPGTGLSYRTRLSESPSHQRRAQREQQRQSNHAASQSAPALTEFKATLDATGQVTLLNQDGQPLNASQRRMVWSDYAERMTTWLESEMDTINGDMELLLEIHQDIVPPGSAIPDYEPEVFDQPAPIKPEHERRPPRPVKPELEVSFWDRLIPGRQQRLIQAQEQDLQNWESELEAWKHQCLQIDKTYEQRLQQYERQVAEWNRAWEAHQHEQTQLAQVFTERLTTDEGLVVEILTAELNDLDWPRETLVDFDIDLASQSVYLDVDLPEVEDIPARSAEFGARNRRLLIKDKSDRQRREEYARHIHGIVLRLAGVVLGLLPGIGRVVVSGYSQRLDSATGHINDDYLLSVAIDKARFAELNFEQPEQVDPIAALERFNLRREMTKTGIFRPVVPIDPV
jgi:hypothetical protein